MLAKQDFNTKFLEKKLNFKSEDNLPVVKL
jgi:hypothetical protein